MKYTKINYLLCNLHFRVSVSMSIKKKKKGPTQAVHNCDGVFNLYGQAQWPVVLALLWFIWTELDVGISQEVRFEYIAAATVLGKQSVI